VLAAVAAGVEVRAFPGMGPSGELDPATFGTDHALPVDADGCPDARQCCRYKPAYGPHASQVACVRPPQGEFPTCGWDVRAQRWPVLPGDSLAYSFGVPGREVHGEESIQCVPDTVGLALQTNKYGAHYGLELVPDPEEEEEEGFDPDGDIDEEDLDAIDDLDFASPSP